MQAHTQYRGQPVFGARQNPVLAGSCVSVSWLVAVGANIAGSVS